MRRQLTVWVVLGLLMLGCGGQEAREEAATRVEPVVDATGPGTVASADGVEIAYTVHRIDQPNLVLVHGWMCNQTYWDEQVPGLAEGFGVVTVDLAGHGASGVDRESWTIPSLGGDVAAVITELGLDDVIVVGHSMGGLVALDVARRLPEAVIGIIGVDTLGDADAEWDQAEMDQFFAALTEDFRTTCDGFVRSMFVEGTDPALVDGIVADMCSGPGEVGAALLNAYVAYDLEQGFVDAGVPIRAINADLWPTDETGNQELADFEAMILEGYGHFLMQEAPDELTAAIIDTALAIVAVEGDGADEVKPGG